MLLKAFDKSILMHKTKQLCTNSCVANASSKGTSGEANRPGNDLPVQQAETIKV